MKLYALRAVKDKESYYETYAYSMEPEKLRAMVPFCSGWFVGASDITNNKKEVCYTDKEVYPLYSIVEVPFVV